MAFDAPSGTRGARQSGHSRIERWGNRKMVDRMVPEQLHGTERDAAWRQITSAARGYARYEWVTDRVIPVIRLTPRTDG